jgi:hypothetical protein
MSIAPTPFEFLLWSQMNPSSNVSILLLSWTDCLNDNVRSEFRGCSSNHPPWRSAAVAASALQHNVNEVYRTKRHIQPSFKLGGDDSVFKRASRDNWMAKR